MEFWEGNKFESSYESVTKSLNSGRRLLNIYKLKFKNG
jgi:hypothetical protein